TLGCLFAGFYIKGTAVSVTVKQLVEKDAYTPPQNMHTHHNNTRHTHTHTYTHTHTHTPTHTHHATTHTHTHTPTPQQHNTHTNESLDVYHPVYGCPEAYPKLAMCLIGVVGK